MKWVEIGWWSLQIRQCELKLDSIYNVDRLSDTYGIFMLDTDASHCGVSAVHSQIQGPQDRSVCLITAADLSARLNIITVWPGKSCWQTLKLWSTSDHTCMVKNFSCGKHPQARLPYGYSYCWSLNIRVENRYCDLIEKAMDICGWDIRERPSTKLFTDWWW